MLLPAHPPQLCPLTTLRSFRCRCSVWPASQQPATHLTCRHFSLLSLQQQQRSNHTPSTAHHPISEATHHPEVYCSPFTCPPCLWLGPSVSALWWRTDWMEPGPADAAGWPGGNCLLLLCWCCCRRHLRLRRHALGRARKHTRTHASTHPHNNSNNTSCSPCCRRGIVGPPAHMGSAGRPHLVGGRRAGCLRLPPIVCCLQQEEHLKHRPAAPQCRARSFMLATCLETCWKRCAICEPIACVALSSGTHPTALQPDGRMVEGWWPLSACHFTKHHHLLPHHARTQTHGGRHSSSPSFSVVPTGG